MIREFKCPHCKWEDKYIATNKLMCARCGEIFDGGENLIIARFA